MSFVANSISRPAARIPRAAHDSVDRHGASTVEKPILASKFKTQICNKFETTGACPYDVRCMFAHGTAELRTKQQNLRDGLVSEAAIRAFRRSAMRRGSMEKYGYGAGYAYLEPCGFEADYSYMEPAAPTEYGFDYAEHFAYEHGPIVVLYNGSRTDMNGAPLPRYRRDPYCSAVLPSASRLYGDMEDVDSAVGHHTNVDGTISCSSRNSSVGSNTSEHEEWSDAVVKMPAADENSHRSSSSSGLERSEGPAEPFVALQA